MKFKKQDVIILIIIAIAIFVIVKTGILNPKAKSNIDPTKNAKDGSTPSYPPSSNEYKNLATGVYNAFTDSWLLWNNTAAQNELDKLNNLSDADLIGVSNAYNNKYSGSNNPTLKGLLQAEYLTFWNNKADQTRDIVIARLTNLNA